MLSGSFYGVPPRRFLLMREAIFALIAERANSLPKSLSIKINEFPSIKQSGLVSVSLLMVSRSPGGSDILFTSETFCYCQSLCIIISVGMEKN